MIERVEAALVDAFGARRARPLQLVLERRLWAGAHRADLPSPHCAFCATPGRLLGGLLCARCVATARALHLAAYKRRRLPEDSMALNEARRALHDDAEAERWLEGRLAAAGVAGDCPDCGPRWPWPREAPRSETCAICRIHRPQIAPLFAGPGRSACVFCLEGLARQLRIRRR